MGDLLGNIHILSCSRILVPHGIYLYLCGTNIPGGPKVSPLPSCLFFSAALIGPLLPRLLGHSCRPYWAAAATAIAPLRTLLLPFEAPYAISVTLFKAIEIRLCFLVLMASSRTDELLPLPLLGPLAPSTPQTIPTALP